MLGGVTNRATADFSVAMGRRAWVLSNASGSFVFSDGTNADFTSGTPNEFLVGATGGIGLYTNKNYSTYCRLNPGGGSWDCSSSKHVKRDFEPVDGRAVLEKVAALPLSSWRFLNEPAEVRHLGPTSQDFRAAFGLGRDDESISTVDAQGVALAAIKGLNAKLVAAVQRLGDRVDEILAVHERALAERDVRIEAQQRKIAELNAAIVSLIARNPLGAQLAAGSSQKPSAAQ